MTEDKILLYNYILLFSNGCVYQTRLAAILGFRFKHKFLAWLVSVISIFAVAEYFRFLVIEKDLPYPAYFTILFIYICFDVAFFYKGGVKKKALALFLWVLLTAIVETASEPILTAIWGARYGTEVEYWVQIENTADVIWCCTIKIDSLFSRILI